MENPDSNSKLLVIVGEKINIKEEESLFDSATFLYYSKFTAHYRILEKVCGSYNKDTITFTAYDHYGFPAFGNYKHALLYLDITNHGIFHETYLYSDLYKTKDGKWASPYSALDYGLDKPKSLSVKPEKIDFAENISFSIAGRTRANTNKWFPEPYYKIDKQRKFAIAVWGNYVPELFQLKKETVLHARGLFGKPEPDSIIPKDVVLEETEAISLSKKDSFNLLKTWNSLVNAIRVNDVTTIKYISLDSINCSVCEGMPRTYYENNLEGIDMFIDSAIVNFERSGLWPIIEKSKFSMSVKKYLNWMPDNIPRQEDGHPALFSITFVKDFKTENSNYVQYHSFDFVKIDTRFRFYKMESN